MKHNITEGQLIFLEPLGNAARYSTEIKKCTVSKVGRKYFEVPLYGKFELETLMHHNGEDSPLYKAHISEQAISDKREINALYHKFEREFRSSRTLSLDQLKRIEQIVAEN